MTLAEAMSRNTRSFFLTATPPTSWSFVATPGTVPIRSKTPKFDHITYDIHPGMVGQVLDKWADEFRVYERQKEQHTQSLARITIKQGIAIGTLYQRRDLSSLLPTKIEIYHISQSCVPRLSDCFTGRATNYQPRDNSTVAETKRAKIFVARSSDDCPSWERRLTSSWCSGFLDLVKSELTKPVKEPWQEAWACG